MLQFFRKYQKFIFLFTTVIIISSFAFFGTSRVLMNTRRPEDLLLFHTVDGRAVRSGFFKQMVYFLSRESTSEEKGGYPYGNFLNDGVVSKDFLETGMAYALLAYDPKPYAEELGKKLLREKNYKPYVHPYAPSISAESIWTLFAPEIKEHLAKLKCGNFAVEKESFQSRVALYLAERRFPPQILAQVLRYRENELGKGERDYRLYREELALFGYRDLNEWFGKSFLEQIAKVVLNCSALAKERGYTVTRDEVLADLLYRSEKSFQTVKENLPRSIENGYGFFQYGLRQMQLDEEAVVAIWQEVLLFRRLFQDVGAAALVDTLPLRNYFSYANTYATIELFELPREYKFQNAQDLMRFERYLQAVFLQRENLLDLPNAYAPIEEIEKRAPELVGQNYTLQFAKTTTEEVAANITIKETWDWQLQKGNWELLKERFPQLATETGATREERFAKLEKLESKARLLVDNYAREKILSAHPEWIKESLTAKKPEEKTFFFRMKQEKSPLEGITDLAALREKLASEDTLLLYSQDEKTYYTIHVKERAKEKRILSYADALREGVIGDVYDCGDLIDALYEDAKEVKLITEEIAKEERTDRLAPFRFAYYLRNHHDEESLWKPLKKTETITRAQGGIGIEELVTLESAMALSPNTFSDVLVSPQEGAYFYRLLDHKVDRSLPLDRLIKAQELLSKEARLHFFQEILHKIQSSDV